jgi:hypothetical protein
MIPTSPIKMLLVGDQNYGQVRGTLIETVLKWPRLCVPVPGDGLRGMERFTHRFRASLSWRGIYSPAPQNLLLTVVATGSTSRWTSAV